MRACTAFGGEWFEAKLAGLGCDPVEATVAPRTGPEIAPVASAANALVGAFIFYQKLYCTCLYFFTFLFNRRYEGHRLAPLLGVVGGTNGIWIVFPAIGLYVCIRLILEGRFDLLWG